MVVRTSQMTGIYVGQPRDISLVIRWTTKAISLHDCLIGGIFLADTLQ